MVCLRTLVPNADAKMRRLRVETRYLIVYCRNQTFVNICCRIKNQAITMESTERQCLDCGKTLRGRVDKKFCDDYCRNNFNNRQNSDQTNYVRKVNNILRKNRRILADLLAEKEDFVKVRKEKMTELGFLFTYHTHTYLTQKGQTYWYCYEYGFLPLEQDWVLIVKREA